MWYKIPIWASVNRKNKIILSYTTQVINFDLLYPCWLNYWLREIIKKWHYDYRHWYTWVWRSSPRDRLHKQSQTSNICQDMHQQHMPQRLESAIWYRSSKSHYWMLWQSLDGVSWSDIVSNLLIFHSMPSSQILHILLSEKKKKKKEKSKEEFGHLVNCW